MQEVSEVLCVCMCSNLYPLVFIAGSHRVRPLQQTYGATREAPHVEDEAVGPTGLVGRPAHGANRPQSPSCGRSWPPLSDPCWSWPVLSGFGLIFGLHLVHLRLNLCFDIFL